MGSDVDTVKKQLKAAAENYVKQTTVLMAIAEKENITLSDKEFSSKVQKTIDESKSQGYEVTKEELFKQLGGKEEAKKYFLQKDVLDWLTSKAKLVDQLETKSSTVSATATANTGKKK